MSTYNVTGHHVQRLSEYQAFLHVLDGVAVGTMRDLHDQIREQTGTYGSQKDWTDPEKWIAEFHSAGILNDQTRELALALWAGGVNPRHWNLDEARTAIKDGTVEVVKGKTYKVTDYGRALSEGEPAAVDRYMTANGMYAVLGFLREQDGQTIESLKEQWRQWLRLYAGRDANADSVLEGGLWTRLRYHLMPLGYVKSEGVPRRHFLTPEGAAKATELKIEAVGPTLQPEQRAHEVAVQDIIRVGDLLGYRTSRTPCLRDLLPKAEKANARTSVYGKKIDACWTAELPLLGEIRVAIEVQDKGSIPDLVTRMKVIAPFCHFLIIISDEGQIQSIQEFITATGLDKDFKAKTVWMTAEQLAEVHQEVSHLSSILTPSVESREPETPSPDESGDPA